MYQFSPGSTGQSLQFLLRDALTGQPKTGLTATSSGAVAGYARQNGSAVSIPLVALAGPLAAWQSGGFVEIDPALARGLYRFDIPDAALAVGAAYVTTSIDFDGAIGEGVLALLQNPVNNVGPGGFPYQVTLTDGSSSPIGGASLWVTTDAAGSNVIAGALATNNVGVASFLLAAGTYYLWINAAGYAASNPTQFTLAQAGGQTVILAAAVAPPSLTSTTIHEPRTTAYDLVTRLLDFVGGDPDEKNFRACRRALLDAMREFATAHKWSSLRSYGRLDLQAAYSGNAVGTVQYQASAGTYPFQVTLTGDVFPSWAASGYILIGTVSAKVDRMVSPTVLTLKNPNFQFDLPAGTSFTLYQNTYTLPSDFVSADNALAETSWGVLYYIPYGQWLARMRGGQNIATPAWWTIAADPDVPGRLAMLVYPAPDVAGTLDFMYYRRPRDVSTFDLTAGTATVDPANGQVVTFSSPSILPSMVGSVLRLSSTVGNPPEGKDGVYPYDFEGNIISVQSTTAVTIDAAAPTGYAGVSYRISDPIDTNDLEMTLIGRCAEKHLAVSRIMKTRADAAAAYKDALIQAMEADSRVTARRSESAGGSRRMRLIDMPINFADTSN